VVPRLPELDPRDLLPKEQIISIFIKEVMDYLQIIGVDHSVHAIEIQMLKDVTGVYLTAKEDIKRRGLLLASETSEGKSNPAAMIFNNSYKLMLQTLDRLGVCAQNQIDARQAEITAHEEYQKALK
jgi:hypothetical protein